MGLKILLQKKIKCCYNAAIHVNFPCHLYSHWSARVAMAVTRGGQEPLPLKVAPIQPSVTAAFHLQSRRDSDCQMWEFWLFLKKTVFFVLFLFLFFRGGGFTLFSCTSGGHQPAYIIMVVVNDLVPKMLQSINNHHMMTSSNGNIFRITGPLWPGDQWIHPTQRPVAWSSDVFFDLPLNKCLSKQTWVGDLRRHHAHYDINVMMLTRLRLLCHMNHTIKLT